MHIKMYSIPIPDGDVFVEEMNKFLRSHQILQVDQHVVSHRNSSYWCYSIRYVEGATKQEREKVDYMKALDEATFQRFSKIRKLRKQLAQEDGVPPFAVFTDEELAGIAKLPEPITLESMKEIPGIGEKKASKYGQKMIDILKDETS